MNISRQLFDYKITFVNSKLDNKNSKGGFVLQNQFESFVSKISGMQKIGIKNKYCIRESFNKNCSHYFFTTI